MCDEDGDVAIFNATKDAKKPMAEINVGNAVYGSPVFANDTLYIMAKDRLIAIANGAKSAAGEGVRGGRESQWSVVRRDRQRAAKHPVRQLGRPRAAARY
jgi:hypothetical protein